MSPEGRAAKVLQAYRHETGGVPFSPLYLGRAIAAAIREAEQDARNNVLAEIQQYHTEDINKASEWRAAHPAVDISV